MLLLEENLSPDMLLHLAPDVRMRWDTTGHLLIDSPSGAVVDAGPRGLAIVSLFARPVSLETAIDRLSGPEYGSADFAPTMGVVNVLLEEGALVHADGRIGSLTPGWADPVEHARMLNDERRTGDYLAAIVAAVRPGDVVLDIGTGSGVLAVAAARAGARHVYAVEASDIADVAERVFEVNGVQDRVTLIRGWSRRIDLPERADLLVTEIIGNEPLEEEILETTLDARHRLLTPDARLVPFSLRLLARPLRIPEPDVRQRTIGRAAVQRWRRLYGINFQPILDAAAPRPVHVPTEGEVAATWQTVGPPTVLATLELTRASSGQRSAHRPIWSSMENRRSTQSPSPSEPICTGMCHTRLIPAMAGIELGNLGLGPSGPGTPWEAHDAAPGLPAPSARRTGRAHLRIVQRCSG